MQPITSSENERISTIVSQFYNEHPFPGFKLEKYSLVEDLWYQANAYTRLVDNSIPSRTTVIDFGCGTGQFACLLSLRNRSVVGIDFSQRSLDAARALKKRLGLSRVTFRREDLLALKATGEKFDYVFCNGVLHHTYNPYQAFRNIIQFAKPGGYICIGLYNRYGRLFLRWRRLWQRLTKSKNTAALVQPILVKEESDEAKTGSWFADQYQHPHESTHTVTEVLRWFRENQIDYLNSLPPIEFPRQEKNISNIFSPVNYPFILDNPVIHFLKQLSWTITMAKSGGYFIIIGCKRGQETVP